MELRGLSALLTGASGFIGGRLAERLALEEVRVRGMVRNRKKAERLLKTHWQTPENHARSRGLPDPESAFQHRESKA